MALKIEVWFPCTVLFRQNRLLGGIMALLMQLSLVFWPVAIKWARDSYERSNIERMLAELSETHRVPVDPYARPLKKFRQIA